MLSDISEDCKERAVVLFKFFKVYFIEQEKKWILLFKKMKEKMKYYRDFCKLVIQQKTKNLNIVESINEVLFSNLVTVGKLNNINIRKFKQTQKNDSRHYASN